MTPSSRNLEEKNKQLIQSASSVKLHCYSRGRHFQQHQIEANDKQQTLLCFTLIYFFKHCLHSCAFKRPWLRCTSATTTTTTTNWWSNSGEGWPANSPSPLLPAARDKSEKIFALSFVKLMRYNGTTLRDGEHDLIVYKVKIQEKNKKPRVDGEPLWNQISEQLTPPYNNSFLVVRPIYAH